MNYESNSSAGEGFHRPLYDSPEHPGALHVNPEGFYSTAALLGQAIDKKFDRLEDMRSGFRARFVLEDRAGFAVTLYETGYTQQSDRTLANCLASIGKGRFDGTEVAMGTYEPDNVLRSRAKAYAIVADGLYRSGFVSQGHEVMGKAAESIHGVLQHVPYSLEEGGIDFTDPAKSRKAGVLSALDVVQSMARLNSFDAADKLLAVIGNIRTPHDNLEFIKALHSLSIQAEDIGDTSRASRYQAEMQGLLDETIGLLRVNSSYSEWHFKLNRFDIRTIFETVATTDLKIGIGYASILGAAKDGAAEKSHGLQAQTFDYCFIAKMYALAGDLAQARDTLALAVVNERRAEFEDPDYARLYGPTDLAAIAATFAAIGAVEHGEALKGQLAPELQPPIWLNEIEAAERDISQEDGGYQKALEAEAFFMTIDRSKIDQDTFLGHGYELFLAYARMGKFEDAKRWFHYFNEGSPVGKTGFYEEDDPVEVIHAFYEMEEYRTCYDLLRLGDDRDEVNFLKYVFHDIHANQKYADPEKLRDLTQNFVWHVALGA